jgi:3-oxoacyl-[acyl-carrier-protein] synthase-3
MREAMLPALDESTGFARREPDAVTRNGHAPGTRVATVNGLGHALPEQVIPNAPIAERVGVDEDWIVRRMGIRSRRHARPGERVSDLAAAAARQALQDAGLQAQSIDLVLVATMTPDEITPNTAPVVAHAIGADRAGAMDIGAACTGWLSALALAAGQIEAGRADYILVIGADLISRITDHDDKRTAALFGDGAGAVVLGATGGGGIGPVVLAQDAGLADTITCDRHEQKLRMDGHVTFKAAVKVLVDSTKKACERAGCTLDDIDLFVYHQANGRIISAVAERLELPDERVASYVEQTANTSAASIPLSLSLARADGRLRPGQRVLAAAVGAGFTWGAAVLDWEVT